MRWVALALSISPAVLAAQVTTAQHDNARSGAYPNETILTPRNVNVATFGKTRVIRVDGDVYAQVLYLPAVTIPGKGRHAVIYVATEHNSVYAFDADAPVAPLWHVSLMDAHEHTLGMQDVMCPFILPEVGITPTPVIDTTTGTIYVLTRTKRYGQAVQRLHALDIATGAPRHPSVEIHAAVAGRGDGSNGGLVRFDPLRENPRAALLLTDGRVILTWASSCDVGPYHGWVLAYDARTLAQVAAFNVTPNGSDGGIWQGDAGLAADERGRIYAVTGNGTFDPARGNYGDTALELALDGNGFTVADYFTPANQKALEDQDGDLGSGGPVLLPEHRLLLGGKGGVAYLLDRDQLGRFNPGGNRAALDTVAAPGMVLGAAAYWNGHVYTLWSEDVIKSFPFTNGRLIVDSVIRGTHRFRDPGATPAVSANGPTGGVVWAVETKTWNGRDRNAVLHAYDAADVRTELYTSEANPARDRAGLALRFVLPTIANGRVYIGTKGEVDVYGLLSRH